MPRSRIRGIPVKEISAKVGKDELLNRLEKCCKYLEELDQLEDDPPLGLSELAISLVRQTIIGHGDKLVRLYAAKAIAEILRVYAPDAPYEDEDLREILLLFVGQLGYLADSEGTYYAEYAQLLQNLSRFNTFLIRTDEGVADVLIDLCTTLFDIISGNQEITVKNAVVDIVAVIVREAEFVPKGFIEVILLQLVQKQPAACPRHQLASLIIRKAASDLEPYIRQALVNILLVGHQSDSEIGHHVIEILHQLSLIDDSTLTSVLPQLEFKLKSMDREERLQFTRLLDKMFSAEESSLVQKNPNLWKSFLGRFEDIDVSVRTAAVDSAPHFFASQPMLIGDIADALHSRCHDIEERVRLRAVHVVHDVACKHFDAVPMQLLHDVKERMWDRKWSVREVAIQRLANLFSTVAGSSEPHKSVLWIPASILSGFYRGGFEDRGLIGTCFADILLSGDSDASNRAQRIMCVFTHLDSSAKRVFGDMLKAQVMLQKNFVALIQLIEEKEYPKNKFSSLLALVAKSLSDPQRLLSVADDLEQAFHDEGDLLLLARKAAGPEFSCGEAIEAKECVLKSLAHIPKLQVVLAKVFQLCCPSFVDGECIKLMVHNVCVGTNTTESQLMDTLFLLEILSQNYPVLFRRIEIFQNILKVVQKSYTSTIVCSCFRIFLNVAGTPWTTDSSYHQQLSLLEKHAVKCALEGTPDMAKEAVKCIKQYSKSLESLEALHETLVSALHVGNPLLPTVITALKEIAKLETSVFELEVDVIIGEFAIKQVLRQDVDSHKSNKDEEVYDVWCSEDRLPKEVKIKILCIKLLENWLLGQVSLAKEKYDKVLVILHGILARKGDLNNSKSLSSGSLAHLRLCAAKVLIKLVCKRKDFSLSLSDFLQLSLVSQDPCMEVRKGFLEKLHKGLATCHLPLSYMAIFSFYGIESDKTVLATAKKYVQFNVDRRRKLAKELAVPKGMRWHLYIRICNTKLMYYNVHWNLNLGQMVPVTSELPRKLQFWDFLNDNIMKAKNSTLSCM
jgi:sister-chromatid-cohesion protein PDS5